MVLKKNKETKRYYSISEVAQMFHLNESTLRYWEKEFDGVRPAEINAKGVRFYTQDEIDRIKLIYHLVKEKKLTLEGARKKLKINKDDVAREEAIINKLKLIKQELLSLKEAFDALDPDE
ncbi:MAG: MerR family transcriptional regulator [Tannerellaceae bacterium]|jgi:DNA-binding transcriptional MerR regulator|nr:MerR family transcriptional regulator [Tannerellaceae bacterium]